MKELIIDDEMDICFLLSSILLYEKINTNYVNNIASAKLILSQYEPDLIFLDNHLPDGLGIEFIPYLKILLPKAKIIMITAHDDIDNKRKALVKGADMFIGKPFNKQSIRGILNEIA